MGWREFEPTHPLVVSNVAEASLCQCHGKLAAPIAYRAVRGYDYSCWDFRRRHIVGFKSFPIDGVRNYPDGLLCCCSTVDENDAFARCSSRVSCQKPLQPTTHDPDPHGTSQPSSEQPNNPQPQALKPPSPYRQMPGL